MIVFSSAEWQTLFEQNGLGSFKALWELQAKWFEAPNECRGGWSGVCRIELQQTDGSAVGVFLKRQQNHTRRTFAHPLKGENTFLSEVRNIRHLTMHNVPTLELLCHGEESDTSDQNALLVTAELADYQPLSELILPERITQLTILQRRAIAQAVGELTFKLHQSQLMHNCYYPKHIFVRLDGDNVDVRMIDVEKAKHRRSSLRRTLRDLGSLNRRAPSVSRSDRLCCLLTYLQQQRLDNKSKQLWRKLAKCIKK